MAEQAARRSMMSNLREAAAVRDNGGGRILAPRLRPGAIVLNDNAESDYLTFVRDPTNGFRSMTLPLKGGTELSVKAS